MKNSETSAESTPHLDKVLRDNKLPAFILDPPPPMVRIIIENSSPGTLIKDNSPHKDTKL